MWNKRETRSGRGLPYRRLVRNHTADDRQRSGPPVQPAADGSDHARKYSSGEGLRAGPPGPLKGAALETSELPLLVRLDAARLPQLLSYR